LCVAFTNVDISLSSCNWRS